ncbi:MAG: tetratricopeptide repeat protein [Candidatus Nanoarchaeia archaeon]
MNTFISSILNSLLDEISKESVDWNKINQLYDELLTHINNYQKFNRLKNLNEGFEDIRKVQFFFQKIQSLKNAISENQEQTTTSIIVELQDLNIESIVENYFQTTRFEDTLLYWYMNEEFKTGVVNKRTFQRNVNELKKKVLLIVNDVKNYIRAKWGVEFDYNEIQNNPRYKQIFNEHEPKIIVGLFDEIIFKVMKKTMIDEEFENMESDIWLKSKKKSIIEKFNNFFTRIESKERYKINMKKPDFESNYSHLSEFDMYGLCRQFTLFYFSLFQLLHFPIQKFTLVILPRHVFARYILNNNNHLNIDGYRYPDDHFYKTYYKFDNSTNSYFTNMNYLQIIGLFKHNLALLIISHLSDNRKSVEYAKQLYEEAITLEPNNPIFKHNLAKLLYYCFSNDKSSIKQAIKLLEEAIKLNPYEDKHRYVLQKVVEYYNDNS